MTDSRPIQDNHDRDYLLLLGRSQLSPRLAGKVDLSGVVQQTLWEAAQAVQPSDNQNRLPWLRKLLANNLRDEIRRMTAKRRDVRREESLEAAIETSSNRFEALLLQHRSSPSHRLIRSDELGCLANALSELSDDQRTAVELHHLQGQPLAVVAKQIGRTKGATAALLYRGLKRLRQRLDAAEGGMT